jgi:hypothetical protein
MILLDLPRKIWIIACDQLNGVVFGPSRFFYFLFDKYSFVTYNCTQEEIAMALKQETIDYRRTNNLCPKCGEPNATDRKMCRKHLKQESDRSNRNQKKRRDVRKSIGICTVCGKYDAVGGKVLCPKCTADVNERSSELTYRRAQKNICIDCGKNPPRDGLTTCSDCRDSATQRQRDRRDRFKNNGMCVECGEKKPTDGLERCGDCLETRNEWYADSAYKDRHAEIRLKEKKTVFDHYGNKCFCCGEDKPCFLAIDHIDGHGNQHRKDIGKAGSGFYKWLIVNEFPEGFQVLCHNCNMGKHLNGGICPHKGV